jgi:NAD(P)-dependent dehydrogenase (short-subunit alcohol dehydrogenase family)
MSYTRSMAAESAPHSIRVNALAPGSVNTDMTRANPAERQEAMANACLQKRIAEPEEMIGPALLLTSDAGGFITGEVHIADGGMTPR